MRASRLAQNKETTNTSCGYYLDRLFKTTGPLNMVKAERLPKKKMLCGIKCWGIENRHRRE